ncbi:hypothetical protein TFLX_02016 [Thermoflexales bacterium]|jgi:uncharacterized spore protein YtfJ|nr:hypothetical protein TFLX_02016 [Thermoflexales bacterium]
MSDWLEKMGVSILKNQENSQQILEKFVETARPSSVFAPPLSAGDYTVITASEVYAGMGVGFGGGGGTGPQATAEAPTETGGEASAEPSAPAEGVAPSGVGYGGGGGGVTLARPVAAITIGPEGVSVEPIVDATKIAIALFTTIGAMALMFARMSKLSQK